MVDDILAIDDSGSRLQLYGNERDLIAITSIGAMAGEDSRYVTEEALRHYKFAIVDFHLDYRGPIASSPIRLADDTPVTTGIGIMSWLRERVPELQLYAATGRDDDHAVWFMPAAYHWFGAIPLAASAIESAIGKPPLGGLHALLESDRLMESELFYDTEAAAVAFEELMDCSRRNGTEKETLRWLSLFTRFGERFPVMDKIREAARTEFQVESLKINHMRLPGQIYHMQQQIGEMWRAFGYESHTDDWPVPEDSSLIKDLRLEFFEERCPILEELRSSIVKIFVTAPDVLHAQRMHRARSSSSVRCTW